MTVVDRPAAPAIPARRAEVTQATLVRRRIATALKYVSLVLAALVMLFAGTVFIPDAWAREHVAEYGVDIMNLQQAKRLGGNTTKFYTADLRVASIEQLNLENSLRKAIFRDEFVVRGLVSVAEFGVLEQHPELTRPGENLCFDRLGSYVAAKNRQQDEPEPTRPAGCALM